MELRESNLPVEGEAFMTVQKTNKDGAVESDHICGVKVQTVGNDRNPQCWGCFGCSVILQVFTSIDDVTESPKAQRVSWDQQRESTTDLSDERKKTAIDSLSQKQNAFRWFDFDLGCKVFIAIPRSDKAKILNDWKDSERNDIWLGCLLVNITSICCESER
jgi:hypothetical protein